MQKHQNFEQEIKANKSRIEELTNSGEALIEQQHFASGQSDIGSNNWAAGL